MTMNVHDVLGSRRLRLAGGVAAAVTIGVGVAGPAMAEQVASASVANDTLTIIGTNDSDRVALRLEAGAPGVLQIDFGDDGLAEHSFDRSTFRRIEVFLRAGADQFRIDQVNGIFADEAVTIDGGSGDDTLDGGDGVDLFDGGSGDDAVDGNRGNDTGLLGPGQDSFRWDPGDGSDVVEGQSGTDSLDFNGAGVAENMSLSANGERTLFLRDVANIRMDMDDVERLDLTALGGVDSVTIDDMSGTDFRRADVDLSGPAGGGDGLADTVTVKGTARADNIGVTAEGTRVDVTRLQTDVRITGSETIDQLQVKALDGDDDVDLDGNVFALIAVAVDLGLGQS